MIQDNIEMNFDLGMIGLGVMGRNLLLNMADHGFSVAGFDNAKEKADSLNREAGNRKIIATTKRSEFLRILKKPRTIILLVPAGEIVDQVIKELLPDLEKDDLIIDAGNSYFRVTERRISELSKKEILFIGTGVSGGEEGARRGPSIMPGGDKRAWERIKPVFEAISAHVGKDPCVTYTGTGAAGHFVKMVHNGIEYAIMQLISEVYDILRKGLKLNNKESEELFIKWNNGELNSYLIEITGRIFGKMDDDNSSWLVDKILDVAGQKGTGIWTVTSAMELQIPVPVIDIAVSMRDLSKYEKERKTVSGLIPKRSEGLSANKNEILQNLEKALYCSILLSYSQGFHLLKAASDAYGFGTDLKEIARIWRGGCIIRSKMLDDLMQWLNSENEGILLLNRNFAARISENIAALRNIIIYGVQQGIPVPAMMASLGYADSFRAEKLPVNLVQAQRDFFGSHTYNRTDREGVFHTQWE